MSEPWIQPYDGRQRTLKRTGPANAFRVKRRLHEDDDVSFIETRADQVAFSFTGDVIILDSSQSREPCVTQTSAVSVTRMYGGSKVVSNDVIECGGNGEESYMQAT